MNKIFIVLLILGAGALGYFLLGSEPEAGTDVVSDDMETAEQVEKYLQEDTSNSIAGSCNDITESSTCVEYRGSIWGDNDMAKLNCEGAGEFSTNSCPYGAYGGCQTSGGTTLETVAWIYPQGGGGMTEESLPYAIKTCDVNSMAAWIKQE